MVKRRTDPLTKLRRLVAGEKPRAVDLFAGCGGFSLGFQRAGCELVAGIESESIRAKTHARNFHRHLGQMVEAAHARARDVTEPPLQTLSELTGQLFPEIDILIGGPPCQAYARIGRAKLREIASHAQAFLHDERGRLYAAYLEWVHALRPTIVAMENVPDILRYGDENVAEIIAEHLEEAGYIVRYTLLNAAAYGVPQTRERWFLVGIRREAGIVPDFPRATHSVVLPPGYKGTRADALRWHESAPAHALPIPGTVERPKPAVTCQQALEDLPFITEEEKLRQKRGIRDLTVRMPYRSGSRSAFAKLMRRWPGFSTGIDVSSHVIRALPRDYETFRRMKHGDDYPRAYRVAVERFEERIAEERKAGVRIREGDPVWQRLWDEIVPPYDPTKFPNKWRKLEPGFPSRTLMAHLSHDSYSHIHYNSDQARTISVREAARLQSFPDGFEFEGAMNAAFGQVGNAVPPVLAWKLADHVLKQVRASREITVEIEGSSWQAVGG